MRVTPKTRKWSLADKSAVVVACVSAILFLFKRGVLDQVPAPLSLLVDFGIVAEGALASLIAGSIFFLVVNRLHEIRERSVLQPWISKKAQFIVGQFDSMVMEVAKASGVALTIDSTEQDYKAALSAILATSSAPLVNFAGQPYHWPIYFKHQADRAKGALAGILDRMTFLTAEEVRTFSEIEDHHFFYIVETLATTPFSPTANLGFLASSFEKFARSICPLRTF